MKIPEKKCRLKGPKKRTNNPKNPYFKWLRQNKNECIVCGLPGEIHHVNIGDGDDTVVVMLCLNHHSAQSNDGLHKSPGAWYNRFFTLDELEEIARDNHIEYLSEGLNA